MITVEELWQEILEKDDRTSPAEYPDMALITFDEFREAIAALSRVQEPVADTDWPKGRWAVYRQQAARLALAPKGEAEPVAYQQRRRLATGEWCDWYPSNKEAFEEHQHGERGEYEVRALYASPPAPLPEAKQLRDHAGLVERLEEAQSEIVYAANRLDDQSVSDAAKVAAEAIAALSRVQEPVASEEARNELARRQEAGRDARVPLIGPKHLAHLSDAELSALATPPAQGDAAQPAEDGWQTMDSAPKDETWVALYFGQSQNFESGWVIGFWSEEAADWFESEASSRSLTAFGDQPIGWMPLPASPTASQEGGTE